MENKYKGLTENVLLLIIAVTLLGVKLSDTALLINSPPAKSSVTQLNAATTEAPPSVKEGKTLKKTNQKASFTFTLADLNRFTEEDLLKLEGVGPVLAKRIMSYKKQHGNFKNVKELKKVKGIGAKKFAAIMKQYR